MTARCGNCGSALYTNGTCPLCDRPRAWPGRTRALGALIAAAIALSACATAAPVTPVAAGGTAGAAPDVVELLESLPVREQVPGTGYDRDRFGSGWTDTDRNGCDTRNDILARDLASPTFRPGTGDCVVLTGVLLDPYTAREIPFTRGQNTSDDVQVDHVVALSAAWRTGAQLLDVGTRERFANDPLNLQAVDGPTNEAKGDSDAAAWLPPDPDAWCGYVARQVAVKARYDLWVTDAEHATIARIFSTCPPDLLDVPTPNWRITG